MSVLSQILAVLSSIGGQAQAVADALFSQVSLLVKGDSIQSSVATYNNKSFVAEQIINSTEVPIINTFNFTGQGSQTPFNKTGWSAGFAVEPSQNSRIDLPLGASYPQLVLGSNNWTIECWFKSTAHGGLQSLYAGQGQPGVYSGGVWFHFTSEGNGVGNNCYVRSSTGVTYNLLSAENIRPGQWYHMALVRNGNTVTNYLNGTQVSSVTLPAGMIIAAGTTSLPCVGGESTANFPAYGLMSNFRLVNGTAVYTANFTPPTSPLTAIPGTALLLFTQYNILKDMSGNNCTMTQNGIINNVPVSPFPALEYSKVNNLGSIFFANTTTADYITVPGIEAGALGSGDFTIETWVFLDQYSVNWSSLIANGRGQLPASGRWGLAITDTGTPWWNPGEFQGTYGVISVPSKPVQRGQWHHIAVARQGITDRLFLNGELIGSSTDGSHYNSTGIVLGNFSAVSPNGGLKGALAGTRVVSGTALYTASFTPSMSPPTAVPGTVFLMNNTNAALIDSTGNSIVSTVGSANNIGIVKGMGRNGGDAIRLSGASGSHLAINRSLHNRVLPGYTIEAWIRPESVTTLQSIVSIKSTLDNGGVRFCINANGTILFGLNSSGLTFSSTGTIQPKVWTHVACTVTGTMTASVFRIYINGTLAGTSGNISLNTTSTIWFDTMYVGTSRVTNTEMFVGYIDDLRITRSSAPRYVANFTPPATLGTSSLDDALFHDTVLQLSANLQSTVVATPVTNAVVIDNSPVNTFLTNTGDQLMQSRFSPFQPNGWSALLNGTNDYINVPAGSAFAYGTGDFCIEAWINCTNPASDGITGGVIYNQTTSGINYLLLGMTGTNVMFLADLTGDGTSTQINSSTQITLGKWHHVAVSRQGTSIRMFLDGAVVATRTSAINLSNTTYTPTIGAYTGGGLGRFQGRISNLRVSKGVARYTTAFVPSTTPLASDANTSLLTLNDNRFKDSSTNNFAVSPFNTAKVVSTDPFVNSAVYDAATHGGSIFFNGLGTSGYMQTEAIPEYQFGLSDFTVDTWVYPTIYSGTRRFLSGGAAGGWLLYPNTNGTWSFSLYGSTVILTSTATIPLFSWGHLAVVRSGSSFTMYINGVATATGTAANNFTTNTLFIGTDVGTNRYAGYVSSLRVVKGQALYSGNFVVPSAPAVPSAAVNNTDPFFGSVLSILKFEGPNGSTSVTSESGGTAFFNSHLISTAQKKFGSSSLFINGSTEALYTTQTAFGTGDFCVEMWIYPTTSGTLRSLYHHDLLQIKLTTDNFLMLTISNTPIINGLTPVTANSWHHIAVSRSAAFTRLFLNGVQQAVFNDVNNYTAATNRPFYFSDVGSASRFTGYVDSLRVSTAARYTANFTVPTEDFPAVNGGTVLLLQGTNFGALDSSHLNPIGFAGTSTVSKTVKKFGNSSIFLNGSANSALTPVNATGSIVGLQNFTVEGWFYSTVSWGGNISLIGTTTSNGFAFYLAAGVFSVKREGSTAVPLGTAANTTANMVINRWYHIALTRTGTEFTVYVDGVPINSTTPAAQPFLSSDILIGRDSSLGYGFTGYVDDIRITLGTARYSKTLSVPPVAELSADSTTMLLLNANTQSQTNDNAFIDSGSGALSVAKSGSPEQCSFTPYRTDYCTHFNGSSRLSGQANAVYAVGNANWTMEAWVKLTSYPAGVGFIVGISGAGGNSDLALMMNSSGQLVSSTTSSGMSTSTAIIPLGVWTHVAIVARSAPVAGNTNIYINGILDGTGTTFAITSTIPIVGGTSLNQNLTGQLSNVRISNTIRYHGNFTPSTTDLATDANTLFLTCQGRDGMVDRSGSGRTITVTGAPGSMTGGIAGQIYNPSTHGGAVSLFGNDYLTMPANADPTGTDFSGSFAMEMWIYPTNSNYSCIASTLNTSFLIQRDATTGVIGIYMYGASSVTGTAVAPTNAWTHIAFTRVGTTGTLYVNGVANTTQTMTASLWAPSTVTIGTRNDFSSKFVGYISDFRITKGTEVYTANFAPPSIPLAAPAGASSYVHLKATNTGIRNLASSGANICVAGNTSVSTAQSKFGGGSMQFNGTTDYIRLPLESNAFTFGAQDFTVEAWVYPTASLSSSPTIFTGKGDGATAAGRSFICALTATTTASSVFYVAGTAYTVQSPAPALNTWSHVAWVRQGIYWKSFLNGNLVAQTIVPIAASINSTYQTAETVMIGTNNLANGNWYTGFIDDLRVSRSAKYGTSFAVPTESFPSQ